MDESRLHKIVTAVLDERGAEINNPVPMAINLEKPQLSLRERVQRLVQGELSQKAAEEGMETFEESQDFDIEADFDAEEPQSEYILMEDEFTDYVEPQDDPAPQVEPAAKPVEQDIIRVEDLREGVTMEDVRKAFAVEKKQ